VSVFDQTPACGHKSNWNSVNPSQNTWSTQKKKMDSGNRECANHREKTKMLCQKETELWEKYVDKYTITYKMQV